MNTHRMAFASLVALLGVSQATADLAVSKVFSDNMVLQRNQTNPVWGTDVPGTKISLTLGDNKVTSEADKTGKWMAELPAMKAGGPHTMTIKGSTAVTVKNILVGEVWICSGQSNMEWTVARSLNPREEAKSAEYPMIRHIKLNHRPSAEPASDVPSPKGWEVCSPTTVSQFTAVGYYFGRKLHKELGVPIGLIGTNWGGTRIEPWTPPVGFKSVPKLKNIADNLDKYPEKRGNRINHQSPLALYNGMIHPLVPYGVRGTIWYQGESNNGEGMLYYEKMKALINGWRSVWKKPDMPFYYVQLAPYRYGRRNSADLAGIWDAQRMALSIPNTGMAVTTDIGNVRDIHPKNKQEVGRRLALWALAKDYGKKDLVFSGPIYKSMKVEGGKVRLSFEYVAGGLASRDDKALSHFTIAGEDGKFVKAKAVIDGDSVVVSSEGVTNPKAVRFGWSDTAEPNLVNKAGLPASPFQTGK